jgi:hypothetical protein
MEGKLTQTLCSSLQLQQERGVAAQCNQAICSDYAGPTQLLHPLRLRLYTTACGLSEQHAVNTSANSLEQAVCHSG